MALSESTMMSIIDNCSTALISSVDKDGFPNTKAMLAPRKHSGLKEFYFTTNTSSLRSGGTMIPNILIRQETEADYART